jgi:hypothetical protein
VPAHYPLSTSKDSLTSEYIQALLSISKFSHINIFHLLNEQRSFVIILLFKNEYEMKRGLEVKGPAFHIKPAKLSTSFNIRTIDPQSEKAKNHKSNLTTIFNKIRNDDLKKHDTRKALKSALDNAITLDYVSSDQNERKLTFPTRETNLALTPNLENIDLPLCIH